MKMTPPMGWNSWNTFGRDINEQLILDMARKISETGLQSVGYNYIVIDDCWSLKQRDKNGRLQPDPEKFPNGMKAVADALHEMGFKFGMYGCAGTLTCAGYPGSFDHEYVDAATFAEWGVDFLKYDYCFHSNLIHGRYLYRRMGLEVSGFGAGMHDSAEALLQAVRSAGYDPLVKYVPYDWSDDRSPDNAAEYLIKRCGGDAGDATLMARARKIAAELADENGVFVDSVSTCVAWIYWNTEA